MTIIIALIVLFAFFVVIRKNIGPALLAVIAGLTVNQIFGADIVNFLSTKFTNIPHDTIEIIIYLAFILILPMLLYIRTAHGGLFGLLRVIEALLFATLLTSLLAAPLAKIFPMDSLAIQITNFINSIKGYILMGGIAVAYLDIILFRV